MGLEAFKNQFTLDGKLKPQPGVTIEKVKAVKSLFEKAQAGSYMAEAQLKELFTTSDAAFSMAHLINVQTIPQLPEELEDIDGLMGKRVVRDFSPVVLRGQIDNEGVEGAGVDQYGAAAIVPEGSPYPAVTFSGSEESFYSRLAKRGVVFSWTWESWINDIVGELEQMPERLLSITKKTILAEFWEAMNTAAKQVGAVTLPDGTTTNANPRLSAMGIIAAVTDIENRLINGRKIGSIDSYIVLVPRGQKRFLEYDIAQFGRVISVQDGNLTLAPDAEIQALFPNIRVVETDRLSGTAWRIYPVPGSTARPVIERLLLRGYENPELRVRSDQGFHPGGGKVGIFEGGFTADTSELRYRHVTGAVLWDDSYIGVSTGANPVTGA